MSPFDEIPTLYALSTINSLNHVSRYPMCSCTQTLWSWEPVNTDGGGFPRHSEALSTCIYSIEEKDPFFKLNWVNCTKYQYFWLPRKVRVIYNFTCSLWNAHVKYLWTQYEWKWNRNRIWHSFKTLRYGESSIKESTSEFEISIPIARYNVCYL